MTTEQIILKALRCVTFLPGSFDKRFIKGADENNLSPLQKWMLHKMCVKYRRQIDNKVLLDISKSFLLVNPNKPLSRRESEKIIRTAKKSDQQKPLPPQITTQPKLF